MQTNLKAHYPSRFTLTSPTLVRERWPVENCSPQCLEKGGGKWDRKTPANNSNEGGRLADVVVVFRDFWVAAF